MTKTLSTIITLGCIGIIISIWAIDASMDRTVEIAKLKNEVTLLNSINGACEGYLKESELDMIYYRYLRNDVVLDHYRSLNPKE